MKALEWCIHYTISFFKTLFSAPPEKMAALSTDAANTVDFEFQPQSLRAKILQAQLYVYVKQPPSSSRGSTLLLVYKVGSQDGNRAGVHILAYSPLPWWGWNEINGLDYRRGNQRKK